MCNSENLVSAKNFIDSSQAVPVWILDAGYASLHAQIATAYAMMAVAEELKGIKSVMMDYVEEKCMVEYTRR